MATYFFSSGGGWAQGTVNFANIGGGVNIPISGPNGLLNADYSAQLQLEDGTNVGAPAPFLVNGLFSGGPRTIKGVPGGSVAILKVHFYNADKSVSWTTSPAAITLAGPGQIPSALIIPAAVAVPLVECWVYEQNTGEPCWWEPWAMGPPVSPVVPKTIGYRLLENGCLELRWPIGTALLRSRQPGGSNRSRVSSTSTQDGLNVWTAATSAPQFFFWLE